MALFYHYLIILGYFFLWDIFISILLFLSYLVWLFFNISLISNYTYVCTSIYAVCFYTNICELLLSISTTIILLPILYKKYNK